MAANPPTAEFSVAILEWPVNVDTVENVWPAPSARGFVEIGG
jgi:hypothetical protein